MARHRRKAAASRTSKSRSRGSKTAPDALASSLCTGTRAFLHLQRIVIGDARFTRLGWRTEGGFVGKRDRETNAPIPDHISARHEDLASLIDRRADRLC